MLARYIRRVTADIGEDLVDASLETLLGVMRFFFILDRDYRDNIRGFNGRYSFESQDGDIAASAAFARNRMKVYRHRVEDTNVRIIFKDGEALMRFLFSRNPDIIAAVLANEVTYDGNLNYLAKFAYMARNLQLRFSI